MAGEHGPASGPLDRYISLLELVAAFPGALILTDVSTLSGLPKTTAHRLLTGLARAGLVEGGGRRGAYQLGDRLVRLLHNSAADGWISALARPHLEALSARIGETSYLCRVVGHRVQVVTSEAPAAQWRTFVQPRVEMAPHAAATAKAILAFQDEALVSEALAEPLPRLTAHTVTDPARIRDIYAKAREDGFATCVSEIDEGLGALGVPVREPGGRVLYSLGVTGPVQRIMDQRWEERVSAMKEVAGALATTLAAGSAIAART
ncbi:IclR family transcriptional regulator [Enterovirga rhinocerotis]|nr:IclR family transcriptional regulator C-terminal domain-containing protein [Enterovirga rhinocerotis]